MTLRHPVNSRDDERRVIRRSYQQSAATGLYEKGATWFGRVRDFRNGPGND